MYRLKSPFAISSLAFWPGIIIAAILDRISVNYSIPIPNISSFSLSYALTQFMCIAEIPSSFNSIRIIFRPESMAIYLTEAFSKLFFSCISVRSLRRIGYLTRVQANFFGGTNVRKKANCTTNKTAILCATCLVSLVVTTQNGRLQFRLRSIKSRMTSLLQA